MPTLTNIEWESIRSAKDDNHFANAVKYAERVASKTESKLSMGDSFKSAIERALEEAKGLDFNRDQLAMATGLLYSCWDKYKEFGDWYRHKHSRDLSTASTIAKVDNPILAEYFDRTRNK